MDDNQGGFPDDFSQEVDDLIDGTVEDDNPSRAVKRMEEAIKHGLPKSQLASAYLVLGTRYEDLDQIDKAIDCYSQAIQLQENSSVNAASSRPAHQRVPTGCYANASR